MRYSTRFLIFLENEKSPGSNLFDFEKNPHAPGRPISDDDVADPSFATASVSRGRGSLCFPPPHHPVLLLRRVLWRRSWLRIPNARRHPLRTPPSSRPSPSASTTAQRSSAPRSEPPSLDASSAAAPLPCTLQFSGAGHGIPGRSNWRPISLRRSTGHPALRGSKAGCRPAGLASGRAAIEVI